MDPEPPLQSEYAMIRRYVQWRMALPAGLFVWFDVAGRSAHWRFASLDFLNNLISAAIPAAVIFWLVAWVGAHAMYWAGFRPPRG